MIVELTVENLAIIERSQLVLKPGFTVLTGETGAGKSLLIDAIELALGERADTELVRTGASRASVSVVLDLSNEPAALARCQELGVGLEGTTLYIQREVAAKGGSQCRIGGKLTPVSTLRQLGSFLVDLHGQHDHQSLLDAERHIGFLDEWIGGPVVELLQRIEAAHERALEANRRLTSFRQGLRDREHRLDLLRFQVNEIEAVNPQPGELEELDAQLSRLKYAEKLATASFGALATVADQENCAIDQLGEAVKLLESAIRYDASLESVVAPMREALIEVEEAAHTLRGYSENLEADPARLDEVAGRIDSLKRLRRKYGADENEVLEFLHDAREQLALLEDGEASEEELVEAASRAGAALNEVASELTSLRKERAVEFAERTQHQLRDLAMDRAVFSVDIRPKPADATGADQVEFFFSANLGEPPRPLGKIASGGEISRVMLAIKTAMAGRAGVPTLIFDEVDAGLGGRAAVTVARKLGELAEHYQVLVITHLPQIAGRADHHFRIEKDESSGRVVTSVRLLEEHERVEEIARMLAGDHVTDAVRANAREMLGSLGVGR
ncbi:DNA repair protein RecN [Fimbriimonas ginsengisoli]|uniref:DNA repair protein RecN n=1 Tax=Fimbriimonas ginsengisoli Gsoil 348 TaxID=661478 RepID=A0A068NRH9_FIMGI|nr:DNA repair protein RecN [Fimbriimonas ginsengisoli]AIE86128.1 DNA repair protein RecN [Fimbriimonas ginsengisoli Gsoil 348]